MQTSIHVSPSAADFARDPAGRRPARIAVVIPCRNEASTIGEVIRGLRQSLPSAAIWVCDNVRELIDRRLEMVVARRVTPSHRRRIERGTSPPTVRSRG